MKSEHGDTLIVIIVILAAVIILVVFPLLIIADSTEDSLQATLQTEVDKFTSDVSNKRVLTADDLDRLVTKISNPNTYDVEIEIQKLDENVQKKTIQVNSKVEGENVYIVLYTSQINDMLKKEGKVELNPGDTITVTATSMNQSTAGQLTGQDANVPEHTASSTKLVP